MYNLEIEDYKRYIDHIRSIKPCYKDMIFDFDTHKWVKSIIKETKPKKHKYTARQTKRIEFAKIRPIVLDRDNYKCVECGSENRVQVHHKIKLSDGGLNYATNLITLCYSCHCEKHTNDQVHNLMIKSV